jgi:hypothetical protein
MNMTTILSAPQHVAAVINRKVCAEHLRPSFVNVSRLETADGCLSPRFDTR